MYTFNIRFACKMLLNALQMDFQIVILQSFKRYNVHTDAEARSH